MTTDKDIKNSIRFLLREGKVIFAKDKGRFRTNFIGLYYPTLTVAFHGDYNGDTVYLYGASECKDIYTEYLEEMLPDTIIVVCK